MKTDANCITVFAAEIASSQTGDLWPSNDLLAISASIITSLQGTEQLVYNKNRKERHNFDVTLISGSS